MNSEILYQTVFARGTTFVTSRIIKGDLTTAGVPCGLPHGWPIRDAEDEEFLRAQPRLVKWRVGVGPRGMIAYSIADDVVADALGPQLGYVRLRG
jgi:hypothetical protein